MKKGVPPARFRAWLALPPLVSLLLAACAEPGAPSPGITGVDAPAAKKQPTQTATLPTGFQRPFSAESPWNRPLASYASVRYAGTAAIAGPRYSALSTWMGSAWVGIHRAGSTDPVVRLYHHPDAWRKVRAKEWKRSGNSPEVEATIRAGLDRDWMGYQANMYSTTLATGFGLPTGYHRREDSYWALEARIPAGVVPPPDVDGYFAVLQPNGWVMEAMAPILLSTGELVSLFVSFTDPTGNGSGIQSGRRASMVPSYAGVIRDGEITAGAIEHALCVALGADDLSTKEIRWPATAMDRNPTDYTGTLGMGTLLALPPQLDVDAMGLETRAARVIARAAQKYGMYVLDRTGSGMMLLCTEQAARDVPSYSWTFERDLDRIREALQVTTVG